LQKEGIFCVENKRESNHSLEIRFTSWKNYHRCWKIDLFRLNLRKEFLFLNKLKLTKFSCRVSDDLKNKLFDLDKISHRQLAFLIGTEPANLAYHKSEKGFIDVKHLVALAEVNSLHLDTIKEGVEEFRVNKITPVKDKDFIDFIFDLKSYIV